MPHSVMRLPRKREDLDSMTSTHIKNQGSVVCAYNSSTGELGRPLGFSGSQDK